MSDVERNDEAGDETVVRPLVTEIQAAAATGATGDAGGDDDATVVRSSTDSNALDLDDTAPRLLRRAERRRRNAAPASTESMSFAPSASVAMPVEDPESGRGSTSRKQQGFDSVRRISPVPGSAPWDPEPVSERGIRPDTMVVYGPRSTHMGDTHLGIDEVHLRAGDAPPARDVTVRPARQKLPSLVARSRRSRYLTLLIGGVVVLISLAGLWVIASLAFG